MPSSFCSLESSKVWSRFSSWDSCALSSSRSTCCRVPMLRSISLSCCSCASLPSFSAVSSPSPMVRMFWCMPLLHSCCMSRSCSSRASFACDSCCSMALMRSRLRRNMRISSRMTARISRIRIAYCIVYFLLFYSLYHAVQDCQPSQKMCRMDEKMLAINAEIVYNVFMCYFIYDRSVYI